MAWPSTPKFLIARESHTGPGAPYGNPFLPPNRCTNLWNVAWSSTHTYSRDDTVSNGGLFRSTRGGNTNHDTSDPAWWEVVRGTVPVTDPGTSPFTYRNPMSLGDQANLLYRDLANSVSEYGFMLDSGVYHYVGERCGADQWAESEVDANNLGPAVRVSRDQQTMYYALCSTVIDQPDIGITNSATLIRRVAGIDTVLDYGEQYYSWASKCGAARIVAEGNILTVQLRGEGYDPLLLTLDTDPWVTVITYTDTSPDAIALGQPGWWTPSGASHISCCDFGGALTPWSIASSDSGATGSQAIPTGGRIALTATASHVSGTTVSLSGYRDETSTITVT